MGIGFSYRVSGPLQQLFFCLKHLFLALFIEKLVDKSPSVKNPARNVFQISELMYNASLF